MLSNAYFLAKFRFDAVENEPAKNLQKFAKVCKICRARRRRAARPWRRSAPPHFDFRVPIEGVPPLFEKKRRSVQRVPTGLPSALEGSVTLVYIPTAKSILAQVALGVTRVEIILEV